MIQRRLLMGGGGSFVQPSDLTASQLIAAPHGGWTWFIDARAVQYNGKTYLGWEPGTGNPEVVAFNSSNAQIGSIFDLNTEAVDDHKNPALLVRDSDKRVLVFFAGHGETVMYLRIATNPEDVTAFAAKVDLDAQLGGTAYTYPNPVQLLSETNDPIYLFYRDVPSGVTWAYSTSTDGGATWAAQTVLLQAAAARSPYIRFVSNGTDRIDFAVSDGHPMYDADVSIWHAYYTGGNLYQTDGTLIGAVGAGPYEASDLTLVYDGTADTAWVWDVVNISGTPYIAHSRYPSTTDHRYNYARWSGSAWVDNQVVAGGTYIPTSAIGANPLEVYYSGGISLDPQNPNVVYCSVGLGGGRWDIYRYVTTNGGTTWAGTPLTSSGKNVRPASVKDYAAGLQVLWFEGTYANYESYSCRTMGAGT